MFVADVTAVAFANGRRRFNENVMIELGYALASKRADEIIFVEMAREDIEVGGLPFDIANVQRIVGKTGSKEPLIGRLKAEIAAIGARKGWILPNH